MMKVSPTTPKHNTRKGDKESEGQWVVLEERECVCVGGRAKAWKRRRRHEMTMKVSPTTPKHEAPTHEKE